MSGTLIDLSSLIDPEDENPTKLNFATFVVANVKYVKKLEICLSNIAIPCICNEEGEGCLSY